MPSALPTALGYDAVGLAERHGPQVMDRLPRVGCVFTHAGQWWWIVPSQSDIGLDWPAMARYAVDALVPDPAPESSPGIWRAHG